MDPVGASMHVDFCKRQHDTTNNPFEADLHGTPPAQTQSSRGLSRAATVAYASGRQQQQSTPQQTRPVLQQTISSPAPPTQRPYYENVQPIAGNSLIGRELNLTFYRSAASHEPANDSCQPTFAASLAESRRRGLFAFSRLECEILAFVVFMRLYRCSP